MPRSFVILTGKRFGKLIVTSEPIRRDNKTYYECVCDCGNQTLVSQGSLNTKNLRNATRSCGCKKFTHVDMSGRKFGRIKVAKHLRQRNRDKRHMYQCLCDCGESFIMNSHDINNGVNPCICRYSHKGITSQNKNLYAVWGNMNKRCFNPHNHKYSSYGGRGIKVCYRWSEKNKNGFSNFVKDFSDVYIPKTGMSFDRINNNGDYSPGNIRVTDAKNQANNTRRNRKISLCGKNISMMEFAEIIKRPYNTIRWQLLDKTPKELIDYYYERGKIDSKTYERTKDAVWSLGSKNNKR